MIEKKGHTNNTSEFCDCMIHPFLKDTGASQHNRMMAELDVRNMKVDARSTADLLHHFYSLSSQINYYDSELKVSDWHPFFQKSIPFVLSEIIRFDFDTLEQQFDNARALFKKNPTPQGLQYLQFFIYYNTLLRLSNWYGQIHGSDLPVEKIFDNTLRDKIKPALERLLGLNRLSAKWYKTNTIDASKLFADDRQPLLNESGISSHSNANELRLRYMGEWDRLRTLYSDTSAIFNLLVDPVRLLGKAAGMSLDQSFVKLKDDLKQTHAPHLALMFAFIKLFQILQGDLNRFSKKHLDFFYKDVLQFVAAGPIADSAHVVLGIQKALGKYALEKGLLLNAGIDINKEDILFTLDDEIVVNHAQVKEVRTLFVKNNKIGDDAHLLTEGVFIAPDARAADGIDKDFQSEVKDYYTVGNRESKYKVPGTTIFKPYPSARIGFVLASPVLMLREGTRTITITLTCLYDKKVCTTESDSGFDSDPCCEGSQQKVKTAALVRKTTFLSLSKIIPPSPYKKEMMAEIDPSIDFLQIHGFINQQYYYISQDLVSEAVKQGLDAHSADVLQNFLTLVDTEKKRGEDYCYCPTESIVFDRIVAAERFEKVMPGQNEIVQKFFRKRKPFDVQFSGEKSWIQPDTVDFSVKELTDSTFEFTIHAQLLPERGAVTFFNAEALNEQVGTNLPVVKITLDDHFKLPHTDTQESVRYCLDRPIDKTFDYSLYHFFRNVRIGQDSKIDVMVCGLRNFVVQNDESLQNVNGPIYPFGARPDILDYSVINSGGAYQISKVFLEKNLKTKISESAFNKLDGILAANVNGKKRITLAVTEAGFNGFLNSLNLSTPDKNAIKHEYRAVKEKLGSLRLVGPSFYIGSVETFGKKWNEVRVNYSWKDRPNSFNDYYNAYVNRVDPNNSTKYIYGLDEDGFQINLSLLEGGDWKAESLHERGGCPEDTFLNEITRSNNRLLFPNKDDGDCSQPFCETPPVLSESVYLRNDFIDNHKSRFLADMNEVTELNVNSRDAFLRVNLQNQDFLHKDYPYVLARQMLASGKLPGGTVEDAIYYDTSGDPVVIDSDRLLTIYKGSNDLADDVVGQVNAIDGRVGNTGDPISTGKADEIRDILNEAGGLKAKANELEDNLGKGVDALEGLKTFSAIIPNEPWTPIISAISIDYTATAQVEDLTLIHLYAFENTYKHEQIDAAPTLLPTYCQEGTLFLGLEKLQAPCNLTLLFQLAEATADSELPKNNLRWHYLDKNVWRRLRPGFELTEDDTHNLTTTGIVKFSIPANISSDNTVMPKGLHWLRASIDENSRAISESTAVYAQAVKATFDFRTSNDTSRLQRPLEAEQISKLETADANINQVLQPFRGFNGRLPEEQDKFYARVSEHLRHKGRAIQKYDYERIILNAFPQIFRIKCITHSIGLDAQDFRLDFPYAPGFLILAVIPDLTRLQAGNSFEPKVPLGLLQEIDSHIRKSSSPFVRVRTMNPRYERIHICLKVRLKIGKDEGYYKSQLKEDLRKFFAPWAVGEAFHYKLTFGQCVDPGSVIGFIESLDYVDFLLEIKFRSDAGKITQQQAICPTTARSILVAGDIEVCIDRPKMEQWCKSERCDENPVKINPCQQR